MNAAIGDRLRASWEKAYENSEDWRQRALTSVAVGNGAGLVGYGAVIANAAIPADALARLLPFISLFAIGAAAAAFLPFIAHRHDAGLAAFGRACAAAVEQVGDALPPEQKPHELNGIAAAFGEQSARFSEPYVVAARVVVGISGGAFLAGLLLPLLLTAVGHNPLAGMAGKGAARPPTIYVIESLQL